MTRVEALAIAAPLFVAAVAGLFALLTNYLDDRATAKRLKQEQADALSEMTNPALPQSDLSEAEREQLTSHIETLEAFAKAVRNASAAVEENSRRVHRAGS
ncbi:MAG: hypothetical protein QOI05_1288 [Bradyrhizobium sp.]|jgi:hypothetical protein|nr:hypothetical protein [Bradyrhizobium sp.]